ncbi:hypothetical protein CWB96_15720 [Pseudoalteromonas citrea]|uniref:Uncharacterized protein n=1 Tax=Pseudoalteromonas citrea TaxID=43655 RepID=A0A5S3XL74_9GAMM|nr:hypothetical protein [Pseudoalteromonas citrea]TMP40683.1 hypothetical protein CWB97_17615 [Pseudoalteromonas citrea]TMP56117.1 hypothetical protein CWB96_15720 [Pseudoalteromonas citrea]
MSSTIKMQRLAIFLATIAILPLLILLSAELTSTILKCTVKEVLATDYRLFNYDIGMILAVAYTAGWAILLTLPTAGLGAYICYIRSLNSNDS